ncbi:MAG: YIP1 family protein [Omnitrophica WOR_2 bacterium]
MNDALATPIETPRGLKLDWIPGVLFTPRQIIPRIAAQARNVWLTPMLILTLTAIALVLITGPIKRTEAMLLGPQLPQGFENYPPEQQAQIIQAAQATQGPVFIYVFPGLMAIAGVWIGWAFVGSVLHLVLTLLGGRGNTGTAMNLVAWSSLPLAVRDLVRIVLAATTQQLIKYPGLAGFAPSGTSRLDVFAGKFMALLDIYVIWQIVLLVMGVSAGNGLTRGKAIAGVLITILLALLLQALFGFAGTLFSGINVVRPFFF